MSAEDDRPPGSLRWGTLYALVIGALAGTIALLALVSYVYR